MSVGSKIEAKVAKERRKARFLLLLTGSAFVAGLAVAGIFWRRQIAAPGATRSSL